MGIGASVFLIAVGAILTFALAVLVTNLLTDLVCGAVDPRIRHR